jgi:hypothetical protein
VDGLPDGTRLITKEAGDCIAGLGHVWIEYEGGDRSDWNFYVQRECERCKIAFRFCGEAASRRWSLE